LKINTLHIQLKIPYVPFGEDLDGLLKSIVMKKLFVIIALISLFAAQSDAQMFVRSFYRNQSRSENVTKIMVPGLVIKASSLFVDDSGVRKILRKTGTIRIVAAENGAGNFDTQEVNSLLKKLRFVGYDDLIKIKDGKNQVNIMTKIKNGKIRRYLLIATDDTDNVLISGKCKLSLKDFRSFINENKEIKAKMKVEI
jgi:hypothetical protein